MQKLTQKVSDPQMTFNPTSVKLHVWLYPKIIVLSVHENTSMNVDTLTIFNNFNQKVNDPKRHPDDL